MIIGVLGAGTMGAGIAQVAAMAGHRVLVYEQKVEVRSVAEQTLWKRFDRLVEKGRLEKAVADKCIEQLTFVPRLEDLQSVDLVIEAIVERLEVKQKVFQALEKLVSPETVLATNTSSLSVASIAAACKNAERVIGLHFFNPAPVMKLVEIVPAVQTRKDLPGEMKELMSSWGKVPVVTKDTPAFIVNRIARPYYGESLRILDEGIADAGTIDWAFRELAGFRMGPFELMDFIGHDINYKVTTTVFEAFYFDPRYKPSFTQKRLLEAGYLGRKAGRGFYTYNEEGRAERVEKGDPILGQQIINRIVAMLINEAVDALFWGIASASDIELAMTRGVNYPKGLLQWADDWGPENVLHELEGLYDMYREDRYRASPLLRQKVRNGELFMSGVPAAAGR